MVKVIIIRGPLGIGKSSISKLVAKKICANYYSIDDILSENKLDVIDEKIGCISENNFIDANNICLKLLKDDLKNNLSVIIDGNFYHKGALKHLIVELKDYSLNVFTLKAPLEVCIKRDSLREKSYGELAAIAVYNLVSKFDYGQIIVNSNLNIEDVANKIIFLINKN